MLNGSWLCQWFLTAYASLGETPAKWCWMLTIWSYLRQIPGSGSACWRSLNLFVLNMSPSEFFFWFLNHTVCQAAVMDDGRCDMSYVTEDCSNLTWLTFRASRPVFFRSSDCTPEQVLPFFYCAFGVGVSLEIGNFCTLSALFNQSWFVRGWFCVSGYRF